MLHVFYKMSFNRNIFNNLVRWKNKPSRKPLVLRGARQVGKTTLVEEFSKTYTYHIMLNLERSEHVRYFNDFSNVQKIVEAMFIEHNIPINQRSNTLLFIDEIQESPKAIALLRYFYEDLPDLHVISAGSLLEHVMQEVKSFPVGRIENLYLHPLNFSEYLEARRLSVVLDEFNKIPVSNNAHRALQNHFHDYAIIGGMPEVVRTYITQKSISDLLPVYESIWSTYKEDIEKYARNSTEARVIRHIVNTAHLYVDKRIKFQNFGNSNYRSREVGEAMRNLNDAKVIQLIYPSTNVNPPIIANLRKAPRLQFLDTGLVNYELGIQADMLAMKDLNTAYKGAIIPHLITQELMSLQSYQYKKPNFWVREKSQASSEVDIIFQHQDMIIPIEIKSGKEGKLRSLHQFVEQSPHPYAIRMYAGEFKVEQHQTPTAKKKYLLMSLPYYLGNKLPEYISYFTENYSL